jgi:hypothetical protein
MNTRKSYTDLVSHAEAAVSAVKDPELRRVAFEKILDDLLLTADGSSTPRVQLSSPKTDRKTPTPRQKPPRAKAKQSGPQAYVEELIGESFFAKPKTISEVKAELENRGHHIPLTSLSGPLQKLCQRRSLRRQKIGGEGSKKSFSYSNW